MRSSSTPPSGAQIMVYLPHPTGSTHLVLLNADFQTTPDSVTKAVSRDNGGATAISLLKVTVPIVGGLLGIVLLGAGLILSRRPEEEEYEDDELTIGAPVYVAAGSARSRFGGGWWGFG